jgi:hypothetical protein
MNIRFALLVACSVAALAGCKSADSGTNATNSTGSNEATPGTSVEQLAAKGGVVGSWDGRATEPAPTKLHTDFKDDGTYQQTSETAAPGFTAPLTSESSGTYELKGKILTLMTQKAHFATEDKSKAPAIEAENKTLTDDFIKKQKPSLNELEWKSNDEFVMKRVIDPKGTKHEVDMKRSGTGDAGAAATPPAGDTGGTASTGTAPAATTAG